MLCWCQPAAARAVAGVVGDGGASIVGFLFAVGVMAGAERAKSQERLLELAALSGLCCACRGTALAACPVAFAVDYSVGNVEAAAWRDVFRRLFCALLVVAVIGSVCVFQRARCWRLYQPSQRCRFLRPPSAPRAPAPHNSRLRAMHLAPAHSRTTSPGCTSPSM